MKAQTFGDEAKSFSHLLKRRTLEINPNHPIIKDLNVRSNPGVGLLSEWFGFNLYFIWRTEKYVL